MTTIEFARAYFISEMTRRNAIVEATREQYGTDSDLYWRALGSWKRAMKSVECLTHRLAKAA